MLRKDYANCMCNGVNCKFCGAIYKSIERQRKWRCCGSSSREPYCNYLRVVIDFIYKRANPQKNIYIWRFKV